MTRSAQERYDFAIAGGGPSGAAAAILLARAGARVVLADLDGGEARFEGASPRLVAALVDQRLATDGIGRAMPRAARWGSITGAANREHAVLRPAFDAALRAQAADEGVRVIRDAVRAVSPGQLALARTGLLTARLVIEARGRRAAVGGARKRGVPTLAIGGWHDSAEAGSRIVAAAQGWRWQIGDGRRCWRQVTIDAATPRSAVQEVWSSVSDWPFPDAPMLRGAELRLAAPDLDPGLLRIGDAAVAMDPLSGHGLFWALASALHAVPLARALIDGQTALAARFYRARVVDTFYRQARIGRDFYRAAALDTPFWHARAAWPDNAPAEPAGPIEPQIWRQVIVRDGALAEAEVLVTRQDPGGVAFVHGVEIVPLLRRLGHARAGMRTNLTDLAGPGIAPDRAGRVFDWLENRGLVAAGCDRMKEIAS